MNEIISVIVNGLSVGSMYALLALGLAMVFAILGLVNFAHGELIAVTGYSMFFLAITGMPFVVIVIFAVIFAVVAAISSKNLRVDSFRSGFLFVLF